MWEQHRFTACSARFRNTPWVQTILKKMMCPPRPWSLWSLRVAESSVQCPGFYIKATPKAQPKKMPKQAQSPDPHAQLQLQPKKRAKTTATPGASPSNAPAESSVQPGVPAPAAAESGARHNIPWPCVRCRQMPWKCRCHGGGSKTEEHMLQVYQDMCTRAGVWAKAEAQQSEADERAACLDPPAPDHPSTLWGCRRVSQYELCA